MDIWCDIGIGSRSVADDGTVTRKPAMLRQSVVTSMHGVSDAAIEEMVRQVRALLKSAQREFGRKAA